MMHLTQESLVDLLMNTRDAMQKGNKIPPVTLSMEDQEQLKMVIPMQLGEESAKKMMTIVNEIREGKRPPLSEQERISLNQKNMTESLTNFLIKLSTVNEEELAVIIEMCEAIRASRSGH
ncbi:hypothetical protein JCM14036_12730 [Desulfotomaculum defluvii]